MSNRVVVTELRHLQLYRQPDRYLQSVGRACWWITGEWLVGLTAG